MAVEQGPDSPDTLDMGLDEISMDFEPSYSGVRVTPMPGLALRPHPDCGDGLIVGPEDPGSLNRVFAGYELLSLIDRSPIANWYRAKKDAEPTVLLKIIDPLEPLDVRVTADELLTMMAREAQYRGGVGEHTSLLTMCDHGVYSGARYIAYADEDLEPLDTDSAEILSFQSTALQMIDAVAVLHEKDLVHGSLSLKAFGRRRDGSICLRRFPFIKEAQEAVHPLYNTYPDLLIPEFLHEKIYDTCSDQFQLGMAFYELLTGTRPFRGLEDHVVHQAICNTAPRPAQREQPLSASLV